MKLIVYAMRTFDELDFFQKLCAENDVELAWCEDYCSPRNIEQARGCDVVCTPPQYFGRDVVTRLHELGVGAIATRAIGYDHIDLDAARELGMHVSHGAYDPESVANYAIMLAMMSLRRVPQALARAQVQDYSLEGKIGRDISGCTVGVVGTGKIGGTVVEHLVGFGCELLAYDLYPRDDIAEKATYVPLDELLARSDVVSLHAPATAQNRHMIDAEQLSLMKGDAILVNTARGSLINTSALIAALKEGRLGGAALDVLEDEAGLYYVDRTGDVIDNDSMAILRCMPNVLLTPHTAFYTEVDVYQMAASAVAGAVAMMRGDLDHPLVLF